MGNRKIITTFVFIFIFCAASIVSGAPKKRVAVMNFANYGAGNVAFLKNALPESLSSTLSANNDIRVVERRQLGKLINEIALEQTGLVNTKGVSRAGRLARADVLILGSISGTRNNIIVTMKAVEVASGKILDGKVVKSTMGDVFDRAGQAAQAMAAVISGKGIGRLSVSSIPSGATVYIDGLDVGKTPVVEYKLTKGEHRIKVAKGGYIEYEKDVDIKAEERRQVSAQLTVDTIGDRSEFNFLVLYSLPFNEDLNGGLYYALSYGHTFDRFLVAFEFGISWFGHNQVVERIPDIWDETIIRNYLLISMNASVTYSIIPNSWAISRFIQPYAGIIIAYNPLIEYRNEERDRLETNNLFGIGAKGGANLFPFSKFSLFAEVRYMANFPAIKRDSFSGDAGSTTITPEKIYWNNLSVGGGVRIYF